MTDITHQPDAPAHAATAPRHPGASAIDPALLDVAELLFFAYRDFIGEPDEILAEFGFGRAHHRVLHFVTRNPGLRVADLLVILKITKQSLGRVLKQLVDEGYIQQETGKTDRRERRLFPTPLGRALTERLARPQAEKLARSLAAAGDASVPAVRRFLHEMIAEDARSGVDGLSDGRAQDRSPRDRSQ